MAEKAKAGDVGARAREASVRNGVAWGVESSHQVGGFFFERGVSDRSFDRSGYDSGAEWLREKEEVAGLGTGV